MSDYEILGVPENASLDDVKSAYRSAVKHLHPDVNDAPNAARMFRLVQDAYDRLIAGTPRLADPKPEPQVVYRTVYVSEQELKLQEIERLAQQLREISEREKAEEEAARAKRKEEWRQKTFLQKIFYLMQRAGLWIRYGLLKLLSGIGALFFLALFGIIRLCSYVSALGAMFMFLIVGVTGLIIFFSLQGGLQSFLWSGLITMLLFAAALAVIWFLSEHFSDLPLTAASFVWELPERIRPKY